METVAEPEVRPIVTAIMIPSTAVTSSRAPARTWNMQSFNQNPVCSLEQVMSEELAMSIQKDEEDSFKREIEISTKVELLEDEAIAGVGSEDVTSFQEDSIGECQSDLLLAQMLQAEFDMEHDAALKNEEKKFNGASKVTVSFVNYRKVPDRVIGKDDDSSEEEILEPRHLDSFDYAEKNSPTIGKNGISVSKQDKVITTKHDATICGHRNACRVMEFPPGIETGDGGSFDMKLSNRVFNKLKLYSASEEKRSKRLQDKTDKSTSIQVLDPKTRLMLFKMVNSEILESIQGCIATGKESVVFHSFGGQTAEMRVPAECAIKVFKTTLNEFKNREKYMNDDYRFRDRFSKQNPRKIIRQWAEKEFHNLTRMKKCGIDCPEPVTLKKHILVMSFVGVDQKPAPKLKDAHLSNDSMQEAYHQIVEIMKRIFDSCQLVHADLSEYNILWHNDIPWIIDVSQAVDRNHPQALEFLLRDCNNISSFFGKHGVTDVLAAEKLFAEITGLYIPGEGTELLERLHNYARDNEQPTFGMTYKPYPFDDRQDHDDDDDDDGDDNPTD